MNASNPPFKASTQPRACSGGDIIAPPGAHLDFTGHDQGQSSYLPPPEYHDWTAVPDISEYPPPPSLGYEISPFSNASLSDADRAHEWCRQNSLWPSRNLSSNEIKDLRSGRIGLHRPKEFQGNLEHKSSLWAGQKAQTVIKGKSTLGCKDTCLVTTLPLYCARIHSPSITEISKTIYFEVKLLSIERQNDDASSIALGFVALPYPTWRLPGWERGSLGVHGDDGRRYVNDTWGGKDFVSLFKENDILGLGMTFCLSKYSPSASAPQTIDVDIFFTRNGKKESTWKLHEERDANDDLGVEGLEGHHDLYASVGIYGGVEFEASFHDWTQ